MSTIVPQIQDGTHFPALEGQFIQGPQGISLYVESYGDPSAQTRILLVHGAFQSSLCYRRQIEVLVEQGCYVVAFDLPWHGFSGPTPEQRELVPTAEVFGDSLEAVCAHFGLLEKPIFLLGWSFGGIVIRNFLLQKSPRNVAGLVFVAALLDLEAYMSLAMGNAKISEVIQGVLAPTTLMSDRQANFQRFVELLWYRPPCLEEYYRVLGYNYRSFSTCMHVTEALFGTQAPGEFRQTLKDMNCPILMVQGQNDQLIPPLYTRQFANGLPQEQVRLLEIPSCGHSPFLECPDTFNEALLDFVASPVRHFVSMKP